MISIENQKQGLTAKPFKIGSGFPIATSNLLENGNNIRPNNEVWLTTRDTVAAVIIVFQAVHGYRGKQICIAI